MRNGLIALLSLCRLAVLSILKKGVLRFKPVQDISPTARVRLQRGAALELGEKTHMRPRTAIQVMPGGHMKIGAHCYLGEGSQLVCKSEVTLGSGVSFGPNVLVYDHDHIIIPGGGFKREEYNTAKVTIGDDVWIGAGTIVLRGTTLGDRCVVGAGCVLKGNYPSDSLIVQKRQTTVTSIV